MKRQIKKILAALIISMSASTLMIFPWILLSCSEKTDPQPTVNPSLIIPGGFYSNRGYNNICETSDGGVAIVCRTTDFKVYIAKISKSFTLQWSKTFDSAVNNAGGICPTSDGGVIVAANMYDTSNTKHRVIIRKVNQNGTSVWVKTFWYDIWDTQAFPVRRTADNGFVILVSDHYPGILFPNRPTLLKINAYGDSLWSKGLPDMPGNVVANNLLVMPDGGFLVAGRGALLQTDHQGNKIWIKENNLDYINLVSLGNDKYAVSCDSSFDQSQGHVDQQDMILFKFDAAGNKLMSGVYDHGFEDHSYSLVYASDGGYYLLAQDFWDLYSKPPYLIRTDEHGMESSWVKLPGLHPCGLLKIPSWYVYFGFYQVNGANGYSLIVYGFN